MGAGRLCSGGAYGVCICGRLHLGDESTREDEEKNGVGKGLGLKSTACIALSVSKQRKSSHGFSS
jgi:hypothetical protein